MNILRLITVLPLLFSSSLFAQTCVDNIEASTPNTRFDINDTEIYDRETDLVWQRCTLGLSGSACDEGDFQALTWQAALQNAENEQGGWRLPNIKELLSIVEDQCSSPSINLTVFPNTATNIYWSATPVASDAARAWYVSQGNADKNPKTSEHYVRLVRDATADDKLNLPTFNDALWVFTQSGAIKTNADLSHIESFDSDPTSAEEVDFVDFTKSVYGKYYMVTSNGLSVSNNQGSTWSDFTVDDGLASNNSSAIATHGYTSNPWLLVGSTESGISLSLDGGNTFSTYNVANDMLAGDSVNDVAIANDGTLYIATDTGLSIGWDVENGVFFENYTSEIGLPSDIINSIWVEDRSTINYVYLATDNGLAYSTDGGSDYSNSLSGHVLSAVVVKNDVWYASTLSENGSTGGIYISTDQGQSYTYRNVNNGASVLNFSVTEHAIYANTETGVSVSTDGGENFSLFTTSNSELPSNSVHAIVPLDETNIRLFASTQGLVITKDSGLTDFIYDENTDGIEHSNVTSVSALGGRAIVITTESGASISYDLGDNWTSVLSGVHLSSSDYNSDTNANMLIVGAIQAGIYLSTDGGETFSNKTTEDGLLSNVVTAVGINNEGIIYAAHSVNDDEGDDLFDLDGVAGITGISISEDGGNTFTTYQHEEPERGRGVERIYNIHTDNDGGVYLSANTDFEMFQGIEEGVMSFFDTEVDDAAIIDLDTWYIGTWDGLSITFDGGESFTTVVTEGADDYVDENEDYEENFINGLNTSEVSHVASDNNGLIYIFNEGELAQVLDEGRVVRYIETEYLDGVNSSELNDMLMLAPVATDSDGDGFPDKIDSDNDNDGVADVNDAFPSDASETLDTDGNGIGNNRDSDDDGDGMPDSYEQQYDFLNALDNSDAELDQDNDGFNNLAEFQAVTAPDEGLDTPNNSLVNKVVSVEGSYLDAFGADIALFDDTAVIMNTEYTADYDFVQYAFIYRKNDADVWEFQQKITASEVSTNTTFNGALAIYDDVLMLGGSNYQGGAVFVYYENDNNEWEIHDTLTVSDGHETLGYSIALEGSRAVIGAYGKNDEGNNTGAAYIFERDDNDDWLEQQKLTADEIIDNDAFSASVALSGNTVLVGAWTDNTNGSVAGAAYIFEQGGDLQWQFNVKLIPADNNASDLFGYSVSLSDSTALIGAFRTDDHGSSSGSAYIYERNEQGSWEEITKLTALDADTNAQFGYSVAIEGDMALIGAWSDNEQASYAGASYLFVKNTEGDWYQQQKIVAPDATADESFGASVILTSELMMIGTDLEDGNSFGSVYFIDIDTDLDGIPNNIDLDNDNDGYSDIDEQANGSDTLLASSTPSDNDGDFVSDLTDLDDDNDGYTDIDEQASGSDTLLASSTPSDNDGDFVSDLTDLDDDNDGVEDTLDAYSTVFAASTDTDLDGNPDSFHVDCDIDCIASSGLELDLDDDNDGYSDVEEQNANTNSLQASSTPTDDVAPTIAAVSSLTVEASATLTHVTLITPDVSDDFSFTPPTITSDYTGPLALGTHEITWLAQDFSGNEATVIQTVMIVDTTAPVFDELTLLAIDAQGVDTDISPYINVSAYDEVDETITATIVGNTILSSGAHTVELQAIDGAGNSTITQISVEISPLVEINASAIVEADSTYQAAITLSGVAPQYPVTISYTTSEDGTEHQVIIDEGNGIDGGIEGGIEGIIDIAVAADALADDIITVTLLSATNAVLTQQTQLVLTVFEENIAPTVDIVLTQNNVPVSVLDATNGVVSATAQISDMNNNDEYNITWSFNGETDDSNQTVFTFDPTETIGIYTLGLTVTEANTAEQFHVEIEKTLLIEAMLASLSAENDSDGDGVSDDEEGYSDSDNDGIADYLDDNPDTTSLPINDELEPLQTLSHLHLSIGDIVLSNDGASSNGAGVTTDDIATHLGNLQLADNSKDKQFDAITPLINFNVSGLTEAGNSVPVIIELSEDTVIPQAAVYRKYNVDLGWYEFVVDSNNSLSSALRDNNGNCPAALSIDYQLGLNEGDNCIQLLIEDGGPNDADGTANALVKDPGVLAIESLNQLPVITLASTITVNESSDVNVTASVTDADNDELTYTWLQTGGEAVNVTNISVSSLTFIAPDVTTIGSTLTFELTVNDGTADVTANITINVDNVNQAPTVNLSADSMYNEGEIITINSNVTDVDNDNLTYLWQQTSGFAVVLTDVNSENLTFTAPNVSSDIDVTFSLAVHDGLLESEDIISIEIKHIPEAAEPLENKSSGGGSLSWVLLICMMGLLSRRYHSK